MKRMKYEDAHSKKGKQKILFLSGAFFLLLALFFALWLYLSGPAIGTVQEGKLPAEDNPFEQGNEQKRYNGKYVSFSYSAAYVLKSNETPVKGPVKESIFLTESGFSGKKIAIIVEERAENSLEASPSFKIRLEKPEIYDKKPFIQRDFDGFLFEKNTQVFEETAFFFAGRNIISVSVTSSVSLEGLLEELERIVSGLIRQ